jgi:hypothetical protein
VTRDPMVYPRSHIVFAMEAEHAAHVVTDAAVKAAAAEAAAKLVSDGREAQEVTGAVVGAAAAVVVAAGGGGVVDAAPSWQGRLRLTAPTRAAMAYLEARQ